MPCFSFAGVMFSRWFGSMSAYSKSAGVIATKLVTSFPDNVNHPKIQSTIMLHSPENGSLFAVRISELCMFYTMLCVSSSVLTIIDNDTTGI